jgi:hypothetical protein
MLRELWTCLRRPSLLAGRWITRADLRGRLGQDADQHGGRLAITLSQHAEGLVTGRQRCQDIHMGARVHLPPTETSFGFSLSLPLAKSLMSRPAAPGSSTEKAYSSGPTRASTTHWYSVPSTARETSVFFATLTYTPDSRAFLRRSRQLTDGETRVLRGHQRMRRRGDIGQFGNDFLLLGQIESHCTPPNYIADPGSSRSAVLVTAPFPWRRGCDADLHPGWWPFPENFGRAAPSTQARVALPD